ncbi:MAG: DUF948 domain-containing protein [Candidatus Bathyarchaeia archaeon]
MQKYEAALLAGLTFAVTVLGLIVLDQKMRIGELERSLVAKQEQILALEKEVTDLNFSVNAFKDLAKDLYKQLEEKELMVCTYRYNISVKSQLVEYFQRRPSTPSDGLSISFLITFVGTEVKILKVELEPVEMFSITASDRYYKISPLHVSDHWGNQYALLSDAHRYEFDRQDSTTSGPFYEYGSYYNITYYITTYTGYVELVYFRGNLEVSFFFDWNDRYTVDLSKLEYPS